MLAVASRLVKPALYLQALISVGVSLAVFLFHGVRLSQAEPVIATRVGDLLLAYAVILVLVAARYERDRLWLLVPILVTFAEEINLLTQATLRLFKLPVPTDPMLAPPLIADTVLVVIYLLGFMGQAAEGLEDHRTAAR